MATNPRPLIATTAEQSSLLVTVRELRTSLGRWPTIEEIATAAGVSTSRTRYLVCRLIDLGCLAWPGEVQMVRGADGVMLVEKPKGRWLA